jgi:FOG: GGDEF domain
VISASLTLHLRKSDPAARYGGDEFCVMLPDTSAEQAIDILERLRQAIEAFHDPALPQLSLTLSIGIAPFDAELVNAEAWLHAADMALYAAKHAGRNCIVLAGADEQAERSA